MSTHKVHRVRSAPPAHTIRSKLPNLLRWSHLSSGILHHLPLKPPQLGDNSTNLYCQTCVLSLYEIGPSLRQPHNHYPPQPSRKCKTTQNPLYVERNITTSWQLESYPLLIVTSYTNHPDSKPNAQMITIHLDTPNPLKLRSTTQIIGCDYRREGKICLTQRSAQTTTTQLSFSSLLTQTPSTSMPHHECISLCPSIFPKFIWL